MQTFHSLPMLVLAPCCPQMWGFMRVPRPGWAETLFLSWGASKRAAGKHKFTTKTFLLVHRYLFLETARACGFISPHAQDRVVVHRVTPVNSPVLRPVVPNFSPSYSQCQPPLKSSCPPVARTAHVPLLHPAAVRRSVCPQKAFNLNAFSATRT